MKRIILLLVAMVAAASTTDAIAQCPGVEHPDFGYRWSQSDNGFMGFSRNGVRYARHLSLPIVHDIDARGPGAGRLMDGDTLIAIDGYDGTSEEAEILLHTPTKDAVSFTIGRASGRRSFMITPRTLCTPDPDRFRASWMGFSILCDGCSAGTNPNGSLSWVFPKSPVVAQVEPNSPAARAGLMKRDTLIAIDGIPLITARGGARLGSVLKGQSVVWTVRRGGKTETISVVASTIHKEP
jgi:hypothetical protein